MAARVNMTDQISPKAGSGGFQAGCFKAKYQASSTVKEPPIPATAKLSTKDTSRLRQFFLTEGKPETRGAKSCSDPTESG
jgi:hypothetical protein